MSCCRLEKQKYNLQSVLSFTRRRAISSHSTLSFSLFHSTWTSVASDANVSLAYSTILAGGGFSSPSFGRLYGRRTTTRILGCAEGLGILRPKGTDNRFSKQLSACGNKSSDVKSRQWFIGCVGVHTTRLVPNLHHCFPHNAFTTVRVRGTGK